MYISFDLFGFSIPGYSAMLILGLLLANVIAYLVVKKNNLDINDFIVCEAYTGIGAILGAKILYLIVSIEYIDWSRMIEPKYFNSIMQGGFVFYGGMIGGIIMFFVGCKLHKINGHSYLKRLIFLVPFVHAFGRIGCFMAGCCYGIEYNGIFSVVFPENSMALPGLELFPVQLLESFILFIISFLTAFVSFKRNDDAAILLYFTLYAIMRFFIEYLRFDSERGIWMWFSTSQWISIFILAGIVIFVLNKKGSGK